MLPLLSKSDRSDIECIEMENEGIISRSHWSLNDVNIIPELFLGDVGIKVFPKDREDISQVVNLFVDDNIFALLKAETNRSKCT